MKKHLSKSRILGYLFLAAIVSMGVLSLSYARYTSQINGEADALVAVWGSESSIPLDIDVSGLVPGGSKEFTFAVKNGKDGQISQVGQLYSVLVETTGNLPLTFELIPVSSEPFGSGIMITGQPFSLTDGKGAADGGSLPISKSIITHTYTLKVSWPELSDGAEYADEIDMVTLTVNAQQEAPEIKS